MCLEISDFSKILSSVTLPSPLWGIHVDPVFQFIAITHVSLNLDKICLDKGVLLTGENGSIKVSVTLNNEIVQFPNVSTIINSVYDLLELLAFLHNIKFCLNEDQGLPKCLKYIPKDDPSNLCDFCSFGGKLTEICIVIQIYFLLNLQKSVMIKIKMKLWKLWQIVHWRI